MRSWVEYPGAPDVLEQTDYRMTWRGDSPPAERIYAPPLRPIRMDEGPRRIARPWREEAEELAREPEPRTPKQVVARMDAWYFRDRRPMLPIHRPTQARRGRRRRGEGDGGGGLQFGVAWWS